MALYWGELPLRDTKGGMAATPHLFSVDKSRGTSIALILFRDHRAEHLRRFSEDAERNFDSQCFRNGGRSWHADF